MLAENRIEFLKICKKKPLKYWVAGRKAVFEQKLAGRP